jgi:hypothetical protein
LRCVSSAFAYQCIAGLFKLFRTFKLMREIGRYVVAASPVFDVVAALPALMICRANFCRGRFALVFFAAAALG